VSVLSRLPALASLVALGLSPALASASPAAQTDLVGWYRLPDGQHVVLSWAADGDLRLAALGEPFFSEPFRAQSNGAFLWTAGSGSAEETRTVGFRFGDHGKPVGFQWAREKTQPSVATRLANQPYELRELDYRNQDVALSGTLLVPRARAAVPAAVMIHGSGESDRDNLWYLEIADHLARNGIAVLLPDKRGCGKSGGEWRTSSMEDFGGDSRAAAEVVRGQRGVDPARVGFVGVSQGGSIAPLAATMTTDSAFAVGLVTGVTTFDEMLLHESRQTLRQNGLPGLVADGLAPMAAAIARRRRPVWWEKNGGFSPLPYWRQLTIPKLFVYGREDERDNVAVSHSVALLEDAELSQLTIEIYPGSGHGLFLPGTRTIRPEFLELLATWIQQTSG